MAARTCTVCGELLRRGVCPNGHPQRAARRRQPRRWGRWVRWLLVLAILGGGAYGALVWYPRWGADRLMRPTSGEFAAALTAYQETADAFRAASGTDDLGAAADEVLAAAVEARDAVASGRSALENRHLFEVPLLSERQPLGLARDLRERIGTFYAGAADSVTDMEAAARYLSDLAPVLPRVDDLRDAVGEAKKPDDLAKEVATARPVARGLAADIEAIAAPQELEGLHQTLQAVVKGIAKDIEDLAATRPGSPVFEALLKDYRRQLRTLERTAADGPTEALDAGLGDQIRDDETLARGIVGDLEILRDRDGLSVTIP